MAWELSKILLSASEALIATGDRDRMWLGAAMGKAANAIIRDITKFYLAA